MLHTNKKDADTIEIAGISLTKWELEVLKCIAQELSNKEIAQRVPLSAKQIEHMLGSSDKRRALYPRLGVKGRCGAALWYYRHCIWPYQMPLSDQLNQAALPATAKSVGKD